MHIRLLIFLLVIIFSCKDESQNIDKQKLILFEQIPSSYSGINFVNRLKESPTQNVLTYEYYYNGAGVAIADFNNDMKPDIFMVSSIESNKLFLNQGSLQFKDVSHQARLLGIKGFSTGVTTTDINNDGLIDIYLCRSGRFKNPKSRENLLFVNQGNNAEGVPQFKESALEYGLNIAGYSTQATFFDYDKDGDLDMFLINHGIDTYADEQIASLKNTQNPNIGEQLFKNNNGYFEDVTEEAGIIKNDLGYGLGIGVSDLNNDDWPDVYVSNDYSGKDHLYLNQQNGTFLESIDRTTGHISFYSMGNDLGDINNDGLTDIAVLDMAGKNNYDIKTSMSAMNPEQFHSLIDLGQHKQYMYNTLLLNNGTETGKSFPQFSDVAQMTGVSSTDWSWGPLLFDFDNDGFKDIFVTNGIKRNIRNNDAIKSISKLNSQLEKARDKQEVAVLFKNALNLFPYYRKPNYFFQNKGDLHFKNIAIEIGADSLLTNSNGAAYGDLDGDGDLDLVINNVDQKALVYKNNSVESLKSRYLQVQANGPLNNSTGIGLKVSLSYNKNTQISELYTTRGYMSAVEPLVHFGVGDIKMIDSLSLIWPDGKIEKKYNIKTNQRLTVDYKNATFPEIVSTSNQPVFKNNSEYIKLVSRHIENEYDDYKKETLLPHKMSEMGPAVAVGDVNNDGYEDFYIGASTGKPASLYIQLEEGVFQKKISTDWNTDAKFEDTCALFGDWDQDGDLDLIVGSGSNEFPDNPNFYPLRFYTNNGSGSFSRQVLNIPEIYGSFGVITPGDYDQDGDMDLFVGGRQIPGKYPYPADSYILKNESTNLGIQFTDVTAEVGSFLKEYGMVSDAIWEDFTGDGLIDLMTVGEWMSPKLYKNSNGTLESLDDLGALSGFVGWWFSLEAVDVDNDGDQDLIAGNLGLNYKYKASKEEPFKVYTHDFDDNGTQDIVLSYVDRGELVPLRGRECSSGQMPFITSKFPTYNSFGQASISDIIAPEILEVALQYEANSFGHAIFINNGQGSFEHKLLPRMAQISSVNDILVDDFTKDGILDILLAGNLLESEVETPSNDASLGVLLKGLGNGEFESMPSTKSGLYLLGETKHLKKIRVGNNKQPYVLVVRNEEIPMLLSY